MSLEEHIREREEKIHLTLEVMKKNFPKILERYNADKGIMKWGEIDGLYRVYHHSFKMYSEIQGYIINCLDLMAQLIGKEKIPEEDFKPENYANKRGLEEFRVNIHSDRLKYLESLDFDYYFKRTLRNALRLRWDWGRNRTETWYKDQAKLCAAAWHAKIALESFMKVAKNYRKHGKFSDQIINEKEAVFLAIVGLR